MFVLNPDPYSLPSYRIGPFQTKHVALNNSLPDNNGVVHYLNEKFEGNDYYFTENGRQAINIALSYYNLDKNDVVTILTTSGNFYISGCVTKEIEKICQWSRNILSETKLIFVNHEFGYVYPEMDFLCSLDIPIIEDCCTTFFSQDEKGKIGKYGDFAVYSFPKFFPVQVGGVLVNNKKNRLNKEPQISEPLLQYIKNVISYYVADIKELVGQRISNYDYAISVYKQLGLNEFFTKSSQEVPSVMMLKNNSIIKDLNYLKETLWAHGIQSSIFYGEDAFFFPSHQNLGKGDIHYFADVLNYLISNRK